MVSTDCVLLAQSLGVRQDTVTVLFFHVYAAGTLTLKLIFQETNNEIKLKSIHLVDYNAAAERPSACRIDLGAYTPFHKYKMSSTAFVICIHMKQSPLPDQSINLGRARIG